MNSYSTVRQLLNGDSPQCSPTSSSIAPPSGIFPAQAVVRPDCSELVRHLGVDFGTKDAGREVQLQPFLALPTRLEPKSMAVDVFSASFPPFHSRRDGKDRGERSAPGPSSPAVAQAPVEPKGKRLDSLVNNLLKRKADCSPADALQNRKRPAKVVPPPASSIAPLLPSWHRKNTDSFIQLQMVETTVPPMSSSFGIDHRTISDFGTNGSAKRSAISSVQNLTTPKLSRHNDAAYYPNIQCILCGEWVCSRNRYMHIESHLQYRPYKCSLCGYDNRKEIFINLHIKRSHKGRDGKVLYQPDAELEHRAWQLAEQCLQHTRQVLLQESATEAGKAETPNLVDTNTVLEPYKNVYRPKIYNTQRAEKSQLIEESRQLGLVPDFSEVAAREESCQICGSHILRHHAVLEEHVRTHLSKPSYQCNIDQCPVLHESKNFISRHMKEVHKYRRQPADLLELRPELVEEFMERAAKAFPSFFDRETLRKLYYRYQGPQGHNSDTQSTSSGSVSPNSKLMCQICQRDVSSEFVALVEHSQVHFGTEFPDDGIQQKDSDNAIQNWIQVALRACFPKKNSVEMDPVPSASGVFCQLCHETISEGETKVQHVQVHLQLPVLSCSQCQFCHWDAQEMKLHVQSTHQSASFHFQKLQPDLISAISSLHKYCFSEEA